MAAWNWSVRVCVMAKIITNFDLICPASSSQSDFINLLFDRPLLLLIVTMLVSTPLLLWLARVGKPARKPKTLPMKLPRETYASNSNWKGHRNSFAAGASFNQMVTALERMMTSQRLLSDISHELRTPLIAHRGTMLMLSQQKARNWSVLKPKRKCTGQHDQRSVGRCHVISKKTRWLAKPSKPTSCGAKC